MDGLLYQSQGDNASSIGQDNSELGQDVTIAVDLAITVFMLLFILYQAYVSKLELRGKHSPKSIRDYAVKVSNIQKGCPGPIEREIQKIFIKHGKIVEIVPLKNYQKALTLELKIKEVSVKIGDRKAKDQISNKNSQNKINKLIAKEQKLYDSQKGAFEKLKKNETPNEFIVVFDTTHARNECLQEYAKYSHWWSRPHKHMAEDMRFHGKYGYKVKEALEPSEYIIENWYYPRYLNWIVFLVGTVLSFVVILLILLADVKKVEDKWTNIPIYDE